jgi:hypothetical protein
MLWWCKFCKATLNFAPGDANIHHRGRKINFGHAQEDNREAEASFPFPPTILQPTPNLLPARNQRCGRKSARLLLRRPVCQELDGRVRPAIDLNRATPLCDFGQPPSHQRSWRSTPSHLWLWRSCATAPRPDAVHRATRVVWCDRGPIQSRCLASELLQHRRSSHQALRWWFAEASDRHHSFSTSSRTQSVWQNKREVILDLLLEIYKLNLLLWEGWLSFGIKISFVTSWMLVWSCIHDH